METIIRKLSSRKLWAAIAGLATGIAIVLGVDEGVISTVAGAVVSLVSLVTYIITEGKIDAAAVGDAVKVVQDAVGVIADMETPAPHGNEITAEEVIKNE